MRCLPVKVFSVLLVLATVNGHLSVGEASGVGGSQEPQKNTGKQDHKDPVVISMVPYLTGLEPFKEKYRGEVEWKLSYKGATTRVDRAKSDWYCYGELASERGNRDGVERLLSALMIEFSMSDGRLGWGGDYGLTICTPLENYLEMAAALEVAVEENFLVKGKDVELPGGGG